MIWRKRKYEREQKLAEAKAAMDESTQQVADSRATLRRARNIGAEIRQTRERNHWDIILDNLIERGRA